jgi:FixJ family two-component response regulator
VDDDPAARDSVVCLVEAMRVRTESFASAEDFLCAYHQSQRGCLVSDVRMLGMSGLQLLEKLAEMGVTLPVILITAYGDISFAVRAMKSGAIAYLQKPCSDEELWDSIREGLALDAENLRREGELEGIRHRIDQISSSERQVLDHLIAGKPHKVIASELGISTRTVETRRSQILKKTQTKTLVELARMVAITETSHRV